MHQNLKTKYELRQVENFLQKLFFLVVYFARK